MTNDMFRLAEELAELSGDDFESLVEFVRKWEPRTRARVSMRATQNIPLWQREGRAKPGPKPGTRRGKKNKTQQAGGGTADTAGPNPAGENISTEGSNPSQPTT